MAAPSQRPEAVFVDRRDAGRRLAELVKAGEGSLVLALPRGGVPLGFEIARAHDLALDVLPARKLGAPENAELAVGAVAEGGARVLDDWSARRVGVTQEWLDVAIARETRELARQAELFRGGRAPLAVAGRRVVIVDDGLATGLTMLAAVRSLRRREAAAVTVAVAVGARESLALLREQADAVLCHTVAANLYAVGYWYLDFSPVSDEEVTALLREAQAAPAP